MSSTTQLPGNQPQMKDPLKKLNIIYAVFAVCGAILAFASSFSPIGALVGAGLGLIFGHLAAMLAASVKLIKLNFANYPLDAAISTEQLYSYLSKNLSHNDLQVRKGPVNVYFIYKDETTHVVYLDADKKTFSIACTKTQFKEKLKNGMKNSSKKMYRNAVLASPLIKEIIINAAKEIGKAAD